MSKKKKFCVFTGSRSEYWLLQPLIDELKKEKTIELQLIISGMHLSPEFGLTYNEIDTKGISKVEKIEILLSSDTPIGISKAMGLGMISYSEALNRLRPDILIGLGDRFELFSIVSSAVVNKIPVAHIHGGEITLGAYDEGFRHSITKMSHLHFCSTEIYRKRIIQLGENPKNVFNVGALGIDNIRRLKLLTKKQLENEISFKLDKPFFVVTFHPVTLERIPSEEQMYELIKALNHFDNYKIIFTKPNADNESRGIIKILDSERQKNPERIAVFESLGSLKYLSALKHCELMIGNSSSGIIEMPYFKKPTVNIGIRQKGRIFAESILNCEPKEKDIVSSINKALSTEFRKKCLKTKSLYGNGYAAKKIKKILLTRNFQDLIIKEFYDI